MVLGNQAVAVAVCATGRALDFATTWVGIGSSRAIEAKPLPADMIHFLGTYAGLVMYEVLITTPIIFLACRLAKRIQRRHPGDQAHPPTVSMVSALLYGVGTISLIAAVHNLQFL